MIIVSSEVFETKVEFVESSLNFGQISVGSDVIKPVSLKNLGIFFFFFILYINKNKNKKVNLMRTSS
jgi:hypothetical protein